MASLSASEIQSQLTSLKEAARARSPGELGRVDQVGVLSWHDCYSGPILSRFLDALASLGSMLESHRVTQQCNEILLNLGHIFRVCSECVPSVFRVCSQCVHSVFTVCSQCL